jgi:hypothetical protein
MDLYPGKKTADVTDEARNTLQAGCPNGVSQPVEKQRVKSGISEDDFQRISSRRIAIENNLNIVFQSVPHTE